MSKMNRIITESINEVIYEKYTSHQEQLLEMSRINKHETGRCYFPYNSWEVKIWSNDHTPPHFHIIKDGWNVSFQIEDGELLNIDSKGADQSVYEYMVSNVKNWLAAKCAIMPKLTNQENAMIQWEQIHDD